MVDVEDIIGVVRELFPVWERPEEFSLDAEAVHSVASVIWLQSSWVKHRSTTLYTDPFLLGEKIRRLGKEEIANVFLKAWHPVVELEQITSHSLAEAMKYWEGLLPIGERWQRTAPLKTETGTMSREEMIKQRLLLEEAFTKELEALWGELKQRTGGKARIPYWDFVGAETYSETIKRAYMTSFLVTYGYATLEAYPLEEEMYLKPFEKPVSTLGKRQAFSVPVSVSVEEWMKWREEKQG